MNMNIANMFLNQKIKSRLQRIERDRGRASKRKRERESKLNIFNHPLDEECYLHSIFSLTVMMIHAIPDIGSQSKYLHFVLLTFTALAIHFNL